MIDSLIFFACLIIDLLTLGLVIYLYKHFWQKTDLSSLLLIKIFFYVNIYKLVFNGIIVNFLRMISEGSENKEYGVTSFEILKVVSIDFISNVFYFGFFTFLLILFKSKNSNSSMNISSQIAVLVFLSAFSTLNLLIPQFFINNLWLIKDALYYIGPISALLVLILGLKHDKKIWALMGLIPLIITILITLISGLRGSIVGISITFIILVIIELDRRKVKKIIAIGTFPLILLIAIQSNLNSIKYAFVVAVANKTIDFTSAKGYYDFLIAYISEDANIKKTDSEAKPFYKEIEFRFGAPTLFGVGFLRLASKGEYAYLNPILNSFYSFIPRQIFKGEKPFPGSADGTEKKMGMYACYNEITGYDYNMTDFSIASHYYWELGWFGVIFLSILPAIYNIIIFKIARNWGYVGAALVLLSFKPFWFLTKLWISEIIVMIPTIILPALLIIYSFNKLYCLSKRTLSVSK